MRRYSVVDCYSCPKRKALTYEVKDLLKDEILYLTEDEYEKIRQIECHEADMRSLAEDYKLKTKNDNNCYDKPQRKGKRK